MGNEKIKGIIFVNLLVFLLLRYRFLGLIPATPAGMENNLPSSLQQSMPAPAATKS
jgi:hypothetical protein